jgi:hypothetical protein
MHVLASTMVVFCCSFAWNVSVKCQFHVLLDMMFSQLLKIIVSFVCIESC